MSVVYSDISVEFVDKMGDDLAVANAARVSFGKEKDELDDGDVKLIKYLANHEHTSPFRHTAIKFRCKVPVFIARQLGKHQVGWSWNEVSRRYVDDGFEFYLPQNLRKRPDKSIKQGSGDSFDSQSNEDLRDIIYISNVECVIAYEELLDKGVAPEQARMVLPQNMMVEWIWTGNLLSAYHLCRLRLGEGTQEEATEFAKLVDNIMSEHFPHSWDALRGAYEKV